MSETPLGEPPARGGRVRVHADAADRARAWRERRQQERDAAGGAPDGGGPGGEPLIAAAGLALAVDQLRQIAAAARAQLAGEVDRIEAAVEVLADPDAIDRALAGARADADRRVAEADAARVAAQGEMATARSRAAADSLRAGEAVAAADEAWVQVDELTAQRDTLQAELTAAAERTAHADQTADLQHRLDQVGDQLRDAEAAGARAAADRDALAGQLDQARADLAAARAAAERAAADRAGERSADLDRATAQQNRLDTLSEQLRDAQTAAARAAADRDALAGQLEQTRADLTAAREQLAPAVAAAREDGRRDAQQQHDADRALDRARTEGQLGVLQARLDAATELAADRGAQLTRLRDTPTSATPGATGRGRPRRTATTTGPPDAADPGDGGGAGS